MFVWAGDPRGRPGRAPAVPRGRDAARRHGHADAVPGHLRSCSAEAEKRSLGVHRSRFLDALDDDAIDSILDAMAAPSSPRGDGPAAGPRRRDGARPGRCDGVRPPRRAGHGHHHHPVRGSGDRARPNVAWTEALHEALGANDAGVYANFLEAEGDERIRAAYPGGTYERLADVKRRYDPSNLFRMNQNIRPNAMG